VRRRRPDARAPAERARTVLVRASLAVSETHRLLVDVLEADKDGGPDRSEAVVELRAALHHLDAGRMAVYRAMQALDAP
jgi:hypothetical protein